MFLGCRANTVVISCLQIFNAYKHKFNNSEAVGTHLLMFFILNDFICKYNHSEVHSRNVKHVCVQDILKGNFFDLFRTTRSCAWVEKKSYLIFKINNFLNVASIPIFIKCFH